MPAEQYSDQLTPRDHDLLIRLDTKFDDMYRTVKDLQEGTAVKIADHETRINNLETAKTRQNTMMTIGTGILSLLTSLLIWHIAGK